MTSVTTRSGPVRATGRVVLAILRRAEALLSRMRLQATLVVVALLAGMTLVLVETPIAAGTYEIPVALAFLLAAAHAGAVPLAAVRPGVAATLALAAALLLQALSEPVAPIWPWWPMLIVTHALLLAVVGIRARWPVALLHWIGAVGASAVLAAVLRPAASDATGVNLTVFGSVTGSVLVAAIVLTQWRRIRTELVHERHLVAEESARRMLMEERSRIARELHDVIAHSMSIITVQSTTARFRHPGFDRAAIAEFEEIGGLSRRALDEMRGLLHVLRGGEEEATRGPQPGLGDLADLVAQAQRAGKPVAFTPLPERDSDAVGDLVGLAAYRIVQEALSNAIRHAPGAAVQVACERAGDRLLLLVVNSAPPGGATPSSTTSGHGLIGMSERAASVGGTVQVGPTPDGGFAIRAVLPVTARTPAER